MTQTTISAIAAGIALVACASPGAYSELAAAEQQLEAFKRAEDWVDVDLTDKAGLSDAAREPRIAVLMEKHWPECTGAPAEALGALFRAAPAQPTPEQIARVDVDLDRCLRKYGLTGRIEMKVGDRFLGLQQFVDEGTAAARRYAGAYAQVDAEKRAAAFAMAYGMATAPLVTYQQPAVQGLPFTTGSSPRPIIVKPYVRADGGIVVPHLRTSPDGYCVNNIRGCR